MMENSEAREQPETMEEVSCRHASYLKFLFFAGCFASFINLRFLQVFLILTVRYNNL